MDPNMEEILEEIIHHPNPDKEQYKKQFPLFFEKYPKISEMAFKKDNKAMFLYMIEQKKGVMDETSQHDASVNVGTKLRDTYITPLIDPKKNDPIIVNNEKQL
jgi:hypothetical protein